MLQPLTLGPLHLGALPDWAPELARRSFHFTPAIAGFESNEWTLRRVAGSELVVVNNASGGELTIPRRFVEQVLGERVVLARRLEAHQGRARAVNRGVAVMPVSTDVPRVRSESRAAIVPIRELPQTAPRWRRYIRVAVAVGWLACFATVAFIALEYVLFALVNIRLR